MKIRVKIGDLVEQVTQVAITVDHKAQDMPLGKVYLRAINRPVAEPGPLETKPFLYLFSSDQASKTFIKIPIEACEQEGQTLVDPAKLLGALLGRNPDSTVDLAVIPESAKIRVKVGKNVAHLPYDSSVDTAVAMVKALPKGEPIAKIAATSLIEFIRRSTFCIPMAENGQQQFAMGVLNIKGAGGNYIAQATDGRIVAWHSAKQTETTTFDLPSLLVPLEALDPLQKLLQRHKDTDVSVMEGARSTKGDLQEIVFQMNDVQFGTVLRVGRYPNIATLLDQHAPTFVTEVSREELKGTLTRAANFVENNTDKRCVKLTTASETCLQVEASNPLSDLKDELEITVNEGNFKSVSTTINIDYLSNIAAVQTGKKVSVGFNSDKQRALFVTDASETIETRYAIMPVLPDKAVKPEKKGKNA
jgi:DNA polymerase III sliding clamp (beta) subunit (PCNA family)